MTLVQKTTPELPKKELEGPKNLRANLLYRQAEWVACKQSCLYFLVNYAKIVNKNTGRVVDWQPWSYLVDLIHLFTAVESDGYPVNRDIIILKARQLGISWLVTAYAIWKAIFYPNTSVLFLSQTGTDAAKLIGGGDSGAEGKVKFIYSHLPKWMRPELGRNSGEKLDFANGSSLEALMSTDNAGRGTEARIVIRDELEFHPCAAINYASIRPSIDSGGQLIDLSTVDKRISINASHFKSRYVKSKEKGSATTSIFLPWQSRPVRQDGMTLEKWWEKEIVPNYSESEREQEYPASEKEALSVLGSVGFFDEKALKQMKQEILEPIETDWPTFNGVLKIYKPPVVGEKYCVFTDPSDGVEDPFHTVVIKHSTGEGVAEANAKVKADICAKYHDIIVRSYNDAWNSYEVNGNVGGTFDATIKNLNTPNVAPRRDSEGKIPKDKRGWYTTPPMKRKMLWDLEEDVRNREVISHDKETIEEFEGFIQPAGGEPQATGGMHDDRVMAWAGCMQIRKYMPSGKYMVQSSHYRI